MCLNPNIIPLFKIYITNFFPFCFAFPIWDIRIKLPEYTRYTPLFLKSLFLLLTYFQRVFVIDVQLDEQNMVNNQIQFSFTNLCSIVYCTRCNDKGIFRSVMVTLRGSREITKYFGSM